jgi:hypothetical protein
MTPSVCSLPAASVTPFLPDAEHVGDEFLGQGQFVGSQSVKGE